MRSSIYEVEVYEVQVYEVQVYEVQYLRGPVFKRSSI